MDMSSSDSSLTDWKSKAEKFQSALEQAIVGQQKAINLITAALFARGHVLLEGDVGVGKTTLLRSVARAIGGDYERIEGTIDLMPNDLIYYTYINEEGRPSVNPGPVLKHGEGLATFFFNEINRARPQVHSLLLRLMAERSVTAFNQEYSFPYLQVYADRNRVEREETFELPAAARDRFFMELNIHIPTSKEDQKSLIFDPVFHDVDRLIELVDPAIIPFEQINDFASLLQQEIIISDTLKTYVLELWTACRQPEKFGIHLSDVDIETLVASGGSPRGFSYLVRAARVNAWLNGRTMVVPEDVQSLFQEVMAHRIFFNPIYEFRRLELIDEFIQEVLEAVGAP